MPRFKVTVVRAPAVYEVEAAGPVEAGNAALRVALTDSSTGAVVVEDMATGHGVELDLSKMTPAGSA